MGTSFHFGVMETFSRLSTILRSSESLQLHAGYSCGGQGWLQCGVCRLSMLRRKQTGWWEDRGMGGGAWRPPGCAVMWQKPGEKPMSVCFRSFVHSWHITGHLDRNDSCYFGGKGNRIWPGVRGGKFTFYFCGLLYFQRIVYYGQIQTHTQITECHESWCSNQSGQYSFIANLVSSMFPLNYFEANPILFMHILVCLSNTWICFKNVKFRCHNSVAKNNSVTFYYIFAVWLLK